MARLSLSLLGPFRATRDEQPLGFKSNKVRALLAYLAVEAHQPHRREVLAGLLWPDWPDRDALNNLRYTLSDLRAAIGDRAAEPPYLLISRDELQFNPKCEHSLDVSALVDAAEGIRAGGVSPGTLEHAIKLYTGVFLDGFSLGDCPGFEQWVLLTRERLARQASAILHYLAAKAEERNEYEGAQAWAWQQLEHEPWDEAAHRVLMRTLARSDQRAAALAQYQNCRRVLADELGVEPAPETTRLYEQIRDGELKSWPRSAPAPGLTVQLPPFLQAAPHALERPLFVLRECELARLHSFLDQALASGGRIVFITGEAGSGKTALLQEFIHRALSDRTDLVVAGGSCNAYTGIGDPYLPFREILGLLTGDVEARWAAGAMSREHVARLWNTIPAIAEALPEAGPDLVDTFVAGTALLQRARTYASGPTEWLTRLADFVESHATLPGAPGLPQRDLFGQYTRVVLALSRQAPLVLVLDDLQWADAGSIDLLFHLGRHLKGCRVLIVGAYRPEEVAIGRQGSRHPLEPVVHELQRDFGDITVSLGQAESREFVEAILDSEPNLLSSDFRDMLYRQTRGHPLFTVELLRGLQERGDLLQDSEGRWIKGPNLDWESLPARVEAVVSERIGRLAEPLQALLRVASVEGEVFTAEVISRTIGIDTRDLLQMLSGELDRRHRLVRADSIQRLDAQLLSRYRFRHILFQRYLYSSQDEVERVHQHGRIAAVLEELYSAPDEAAAVAVTLALHFERARIAQKAAHYLHLAGDRAVQLSALQEARTHLTRAIDLLMTLPDTPERAQQELGLQLSLGIAWEGTVPCPEWENAVTRARRLCQQTGDTAQLCSTVGQLSIFHYVRAEYREACALGKEALRLAEQVGDPLLVAISHWYLGFILCGLGEFLEARAHLAQTISYYEPQQHHRRMVLLRGSDAGVGALAYDACCLWCLGYPDHAFREGRESMDLARVLAHALSSADALDFAGCLLSTLARDLPTLKESSKQLTRVSNEIGFSSFGATAMVYVGLAVAEEGALEEGIAQMRRALENRESTGTACQKSQMLGSLSEALTKAGRLDEALAVLDEALRFIEETDERISEAEIHRLRAETLLALGDEVQAEACLHRALEVAQRQSAKMWELRAATSLGRLWHSQGRNAEARAILTPTYEWFTEGFETADLRAAAALLAELS
jgi:DNA-binding SARP family transcriptional activator/predicted ATPase